MIKATGITGNANNFRS